MRPAGTSSLAVQLKTERWAVSEEDEHVNKLALFWKMPLEKGEVAGGG